MSNVLNEQYVYTIAEVVNNVELRSKCFVIDKNSTHFKFNGFYMNGAIGVTGVLSKASYFLTPDDYNNYLAYKKTSDIYAHDGVYLLKNKNGTQDILFWNKTIPQYIRLPSNKKVISAIYLNKGIFEDCSLLRIRTQDSVYYIIIFSFHTPGDVFYWIRTTCPSENILTT